MKIFVHECRTCGGERSVVKDAFGDVVYSTMCRCQGRKIILEIAGTIAAVIGFCIAINL